MNGLCLVVVTVAAFVGLAFWLDSCEDNEIAAFTQRCVAAGETPAKCAVLAEIKRSADDAQMAAGAAIGFAAGSSAGRR
jgi:hypothetical protein